MRIESISDMLQHLQSNERGIVLHRRERCRENNSKSGSSKGKLREKTTMKFLFIFPSTKVDKHEIIFRSNVHYSAHESNALVFAIVENASRMPKKCALSTFLPKKMFIRHSKTRRKAVDKVFPRFSQTRNFHVIAVVVTERRKNRKRRGKTEREKEKERKNSRWANWKLFSDFYFVLFQASSSLLR